MSKFDIYNNDIYRGIVNSSKIFESSDNGKYYKSLLCLKSTTERVREDTIKKKHTNIFLKIYIILYKRYLNIIIVNCAFFLNFILENAHQIR